MSLLQIYQWICQWKNFENRLTFGEVMGKSLVSCFLRHSVHPAPSVMRGEGKIAGNVNNDDVDLTWRCAAHEGQTDSGRWTDRRTSLVNANHWSRTLCHCWSLHKAARSRDFLLWLRAPCLCHRCDTGRVHPWIGSGWVGMGWVEISYDITYEVYKNNKRWQK